MKDEYGDLLGHELIRVARLCAMIVYQMDKMSVCPICMAGDAPGKGEHKPRCAMRQAIEILERRHER